MYRHNEQDKIKLPYSISRVIQQQDRLNDDVPLKKYIGVLISDSHILSMAEYLHWKVRKNDIPVSFYAGTLDTLRGRLLTEHELMLLLRRIAAVTELPEGTKQPATRWSYQSEDEWVPVVVNNAELKNTNEYLWNLTCCALGGRMVDVEFVYKISLKQAFRIARMSGFNQRSESKRLYDPRQFIRLRLLLKVSKGSMPDRVHITDCGENNSIVTFNRKINRMRHHETRICQFRLTVPCFRCGVGTDQCPLAVIEHTNKDQLIFNTLIK
jgi:hypothetical protein